MGKVRRLRLRRTLRPRDEFAVREGFESCEHASGEGEFEEGVVFVVVSTVDLSVGLQEVEHAELAGGDLEFDAGGVAFSRHEQWIDRHKNLLYKERHRFNYVQFAS